MLLNPFCKVFCRGKETGCYQTPLEIIMIMMTIFSTSWVLGSVLDSVLIYMLWLIQFSPQSSRNNDYPNSWMRKQRLWEASYSIVESISPCICLWLMRGAEICGRWRGTSDLPHSELLMTYNRKGGEAPKTLKSSTWKY